VILRLVAFTTGLYAVETAMTGALAPKQSSRCTDVKLCDRAPGAIAVALPAIWIVKAKENQNSYGNTIELNFLLKGLNLLLKSVGKQRLPLAIPCEDMNAFVYMNVIPKVSILWHRNMGSVWLTSWTLLQRKILWYRTEGGEPYLILLAPLALIWEGTQLASHYLLKAWARPQLANLTEYAVREGHVKAHWLSMLMQ
jgi:hypothetical protein